jgi:hypothetical protein
MSVADRHKFVAGGISRQVDRDISAMADHVRNGFDDQAVAAVLAYGSCLRGVSTKDSLIDFYVLVHQPGQVSPGRLSSFACRLLPPNVYYTETKIDGQTIRAKYAVLDLDTFGQWLAGDTANPYFWARFSQPCALIWCAGDEVHDRVVACIVTAVETMYGHCRAFGDDETNWQKTLVETYRTELRAEGPSRAAEIVERHKDYYAGVARLFGNVQPISANWFVARVQGKLFSVLRLLKASFTFAGAADYLAWKISRHSGVEVTLTPWQRRHPILAALYLLPGLLWKGVVR